MKKLINWLRFYSNLWMTPVGLLIFYYSPQFIHVLDPTAEVLTVGQYQKIIFVIAGIVVFEGLVQLMMAFNYPSLYRAYKNNYNQNKLNELTAWEIRKYSLAVRCIYYLALSALVIAAAL